MIISQSIAKSLFGDADPINKTIKADNKTNLKVIGVYQDLPHNTSFYETKFLMPFFNKDKLVGHTNRGVG
jgi:putative ABC transport system permease protein